MELSSGPGIRFSMFVSIAGLCSVFYDRDRANDVCAPASYCTFSDYNHWQVTVPMPGVTVPATVRLGSSHGRSSFRVFRPKLNRDRDTGEIMIPFIMALPGTLGAAVGPPAGVLRRAAPT
jgi:hypothetical protein